MADVTRLISEVTVRLVTQRNWSVLVYPDLTCERKFSYNTNVRHEDTMGNDLHLKTADELIREVEHCGPSLVFLQHEVQGQPDTKTQILFYDKA